MEFNRIIKLLRKERGITQKQAAEDLGVSQALLSHYEKGIRECGLDFVVRVADYYNVSCDYLLGRSAERNGMMAFDNAGSETRALVLIEGAGHDIYLDIYTGEIVRAHDLIQHFATAFFMAQLRDDTNATALLNPSTVSFTEITYAAVGIDAE